MSNLRIYNSFAGVDIQAIFEDVVFGELQMVSYKIDREKAPIYTMGSADLRTIARGKRLVTGACVFIVFDRDSLMETMLNTVAGTVSLTKTDTANLAREDEVNRSGGTISQFAGLAIPGSSFDGTDAGLIAAQLKEVTSAKLADQLLAFDITLVGSNEYGANTKMIIHGVELMTEASGVSIDDLVIEKQFSFLARRVTNWTRGTPIVGSAVDKLTGLTR